MRNNFIEESITMNGAYALKGTLTVPQQTREKYPAVVLVAGSGQVDRDGNAAKMNFNLNIYKELAQVITDLGFITYRYDKRGVGSSDGIFLETGMWDLVDDLTSSVNWIKRHPRVDEKKVILLGHSEGCTLITAAYSKCKPSGLIMLSGAAEPILDAVKRQRDIIFSELLNAKGLKGKIFRFMKVHEKGEQQAQKLISKVKESKTDTIIYNLVKINAKWQREHFEYDVIADLKKVECPVIAITGDKDFQANPERLLELPKLIPSEVEYHIVKNMDHVLKECKGELSALYFKKQYKNEASQPLHNELTKHIIQWLKAHYK